MDLGQRLDPPKPCGTCEAQPQTTFRAHVIAVEGHMTSALDERIGDDAAGGMMIIEGGSPHRHCVENYE